MIEGFLVRYGGDPVRWARRHGIEPFSTACEACGSSKTTTIPIARGTQRGLLAPRCGCGDPSDTYCVVGLFDQQERLNHGP